MLLDNKILFLFLALLAILVIGFSLVGDQAIYILFVLFLLLLVLFFIRWPIVGIYLMVFLYPFNYWEFVWGGVNVPYVDLVGLILFFSWGLKAMYLHFKAQDKLRLANFPGWSLMLLFVVSAALSLLNVENELLFYAMKYILRPIIFFYLIYVILPCNIISNIKQLFRSFKIMYVLGVLLSLMGIWSLIFPPVVGLRRVVPIPIFGVYPLGTNHNLFAEIFVCLIPIALILFWHEKENLVLKNIYLIGALLMAGVNLLTLSRGGWLAMFVQFLILIVFKYRQEAKKLFHSYIFYLALIISTPAFYLMYKLLTSYVVLSSNLNRLKLIEIAMTLFNEHPLIGSGIGTFVIVVSGVRWYIIEYGAALDAHGFLFKTLAEVGLIGTFFFCSLLSYYVYIIFKAYLKSIGQEQQWLILAMFLAVIGVIIFQFFGTGYYIAKLWLPIGLALASLKVYQTDIKKNKIYAK